MTEHPAVETLIAYQEEMLEGDELDEVRSHVVVCTVCRDEVLALGRYDEAEPSEQGDDLDDAAHAASWQAFEAARQELQRSAVAGRGAGWPRSWQIPLAASLLLTILGLGSFLASRMTPPPVSAVASSAMTFGIDPDGASTRRGPATEEVLVPRGVSTLTPLLRLGDQTPFDTFDVSLQSATDEAIFDRLAVIRDPNGTFALTIPRSLVPDGLYRIRLTGVRGDVRTEIAVYTLRLRDSG